MRERGGRCEVELSVGGCGGGVLRVVLEGRKGDGGMRMGNHKLRATSAQVDGNSARKDGRRRTEGE